MTKQELEQRLKYEITDEGWKELEKMYMACDLDKDDFAALIKSGAKVYKKVQDKIMYKGYTIEESLIGIGYDIFAGNHFVKYFDTIKECKEYINRNCFKL